MKNLRLRLLFILALIVSNLNAQSTITLSQAINTAINNKKNIQAGKIDVEIQQLKTQALYKKYGPQIVGEYTYNYNPILQTSIFPAGLFNPNLPSDAVERIQFGTTWSQTAGITAMQPLFDANIKKQINENKLLEKISNATQAQTEYELAYEVSKSYVNIWIQEQQIKSAIVDTARTWISYQLQLNNFKAGRLLKSDLNNAIINHNNAKQQLNESTIVLVQNKIYLLYLTGTLNSDATDFNIDPSFFKTTNLFQDETKIAYDSIPIIQQLNLQKQYGVLQQQTEKSKYIPVASIQGFLGANQFTDVFNPAQPDTWFGYSYIGLNIKFPLLLGEDKNNKLQQLQLQSQQFGMQLDDKSLQFKQESQTAKLEMTRLNSLLKTQEVNIDLMKETLEILQDRLKENQLTASELNRQENELQKLITDYQTNKAKAWLFEITFLNTTGQLSKLWK